MRLFFAWIIFVLVGVSVLATPVHAAKKRVRKAGAPVARGVAYSSAKLSRGTHSVVVNFLNLSHVSSIEYALSYSANGIAQGAMGSFAPSGQGNDSRDLYFGTCSKGVCTPHVGITNASVIVTTTLKSGATHSKRYKIARL